jgi:putative hydrolase of the HAD superfamily
MRSRISDLGLLKYFSGFSFSDEVGAYKPNRQIFEHALWYLECKPREALHIGDLYRNDVLGARAAGLRAVRYAGVYDDPAAESSDVDVIRNHLDIFRFLP